MYAADRPSADVSRKFYSSSRSPQQPPRPVLLGPPRINVAPISPSSGHRCIHYTMFCLSTASRYRATGHARLEQSRAERPATDARHANLNLLSSDLTCGRWHGPSRTLDWTDVIFIAGSRSRYKTVSSLVSSTYFQAARRWAGLGNMVLCFTSDFSLLFRL